MPGLFDGMRISTSGIRTHRILEEVVSHNIANASNENYSRQQVRIDALPAIFDGRHFLGQGVDSREIVRVRDELLDNQLRQSAAQQNTYITKLQWLEKVEAIFNEPSDTGLNATLSKFWESWSELAADPQSLATRSNVMARTENLANTLNITYNKLDGLLQDLDQQLQQELGTINALTRQLAQLNADIFEVEGGTGNKANDLRDQRDAVLDTLSEHVEISYYEDGNGMFNVSIAMHPAVQGDKAEKLVAETDPLDASKLRVVWDWGENFRGANTGTLAGILDSRDVVIPGIINQLNSFSSLLIQEVNGIYANGVGLQPQTLLESKLGYAALGVNDATTALNLVTSGQTGEMHVSFYDANNEIVRTAGIVVDANDTLTDIATKLNGIKGLNASVLSDPNNDGRLSITLDTVSGDNVMGEASFVISNNTGGYDSTGVLDLLGFNQTAKSTNTSAVQPLLTSRDLTELQTILGEPSVAAVRAKALNLSGTFTINAFETGTEATPKTDGHHVQQFVIDVVSTDTIDTIMAKVNALTATHGIAMSFNGGTNKLELTSTARTDAEGNVLTAGGTDYLRLAFANTYGYPAVNDDEPPTGYTGLGDNTGLLSKMQMNTLFQGSNAKDIALDNRITQTAHIHAGYSLAAGDNGLANALNNLQHLRVADNNQFTLGEQYGNVIADIGVSIQQTQSLSANEQIMLEGYHTERDRVSGVNLDEELSKMIQYQRAYEANARMFATFDQLAEELLNMIR